MLGLLGTSYLLQFATGILHFFGLITGDFTGPTVSVIVTLTGFLVGAYMGYRFSYLFLYASIAFFSAYASVRGISLFFGGFLSEFDLLISLYTVEDVPPLTLGQVTYSTLICILWVSLTWKLIAKEWGQDGMEQLKS